MAHHDLPCLDAWSGDDETIPPIDVLIRPGLRRAFPLPAQDHADDRFRALLESLAQRRRPPSGVPRRPA